MKKNFFLIFSFIKNINFTLSTQKKKILVLDTISKKIFKFLDDDYSVIYLDIRGENLNIYILIKSIYYFLTSKANLFQSYVMAHINHFKVEVLISSQEVPKFFEIKEFNKNIKTIFVQLDSKDQEALKFLDNLKVKIDFIFCTGKSWADNYEKVCSNKPIIFTKNLILRQKLSSYSNNYKKRIVYISTFRKNLNLDKKYFQDYKKNHFENDYYLLQIIKKILLKYKLELIIIPTYKKKDELKNINELIKLEKNYFNKILCGVPKKLIYKNLEKFYISNQDSLFVNTDSTLGYELISKGFKCVFFPLRTNLEITEFKHLPNFGVFWSKSKNFKEIKNIIENNYLANRRKKNLFIKNKFHKYFSSTHDQFEKSIKKILLSL